MQVRLFDRRGRLSLIHEHVKRVDVNSLGWIEVSTKGGSHVYAHTATDYWCRVDDNERLVTDGEMWSSIEVTKF